MFLLMFVKTLLPRRRKNKYSLTKEHGLQKRSPQKADIYSKIESFLKNNKSFPVVQFQKKVQI